MSTLIADTNIFITVALNLERKEFVLANTQNSRVIAPQVLPFEIGNALSAMVKRQQLSANEAMQAYQSIQKIPVSLQDIDIMKAVDLATTQGIYAYDAYFLQLAVSTGLPILTFDKGMQHVARQLNITLIG